METKKVEITPAKDSHVSEIIEIWKEFMDFHKDIDPFFTRSEDGHVAMRTHVHDIIDSQDAQVLVALDNKHVVAYSIAEIHTRPPVFQQRTCGFISDLAVKSDYQRKGIGSRMVHTMVEWFASRGITRIELRVVSKNKVGYSFWKKHGFRDYMHDLYVDRK